MQVEQENKLPPGGLIQEVAVKIAVEYAEKYNGKPLEDINEETMRAYLKSRYHDLREEHKKNKAKAAGQKKTAQEKDQMDEDTPKPPQEEGQVHEDTPVLPKVAIAGKAGKLMPALDLGAPEQGVGLTQVEGGPVESVCERVARAYRVIRKVTRKKKKRKRFNA